jgi:predicted RNA-binding protein
MCVVDGFLKGRAILTYDVRSCANSDGVIAYDVAQDRRVVVGSIVTFNTPYTLWQAEIDDRLHTK